MYNPGPDDLCDTCGNKVRRCLNRCEDALLSPKEGE
jgi:hypothetical protein